MKQNINKRLTRLGRVVLICAVFPTISSGQTNLTIETAIKVEFNTVSTNAYMLEKSTNLVDWVPAWLGGRWSTGFGYPIRQFFEIEDEKLFFRVQAVPRPNAVDYTLPATDALDVDPAITNLIVAFNTDMSTNGISFESLSMSAETPFAEGTFGLWLDTRTYTRKMALQTNTQYHAELTFYTTNGVPALPLVLDFMTSN